MVHMELIRKRRNGYAFLLVVSICLAVLLGVTFMLEIFFVFGVISVISLLFLVKECRLLYDAKLIWDNCIISSDLISTPDKKDVEKAVLSTFGILIGNKIYRWGLDGVHGTQLQKAHIDKESMYLTFGDATNTTRVELLHGLTEKQAVLDTAKKLLHETGVTADITGW